MTRAAQHTKHVHLLTFVMGPATIGGKKYSRYKVCVRCGAKRKP